MKELKFRAWDTEESRMMTPAMTETIMSLNGWKSNRYIYEQYTSLKDCNGVEIYEGDLLKEGNLISEVVWDEAYAAFKQKTKTASIGLYNFWGIVIGNIHE